MRENAEKVERGIRVPGSQDPFLGVEIRERLENNEKSVQSLSNDLRQILLKMDQQMRLFNKSKQQIIGPVDRITTTIAILVIDPMADNTVAPERDLEIVITPTT